MKANIGRCVLLYAETSPSSVALTVPSNTQTETNVPEMKADDNVDTLLITVISLTIVLLASVMLIFISALCCIRQKHVQKRREKLPESELAH